MAEGHSKGWGRVVEAGAVARCSNSAIGRRRALRAGGMAVALGLLAGEGRPVFAAEGAGEAGPEEVAERFEFSELHMGTEFRLVLYAPSREVAEAAAGDAFARVAELNAVLSDYDADSEVRRLCDSAPGEWIEVSRDLWTVLRAAEREWKDSEGAFDVTIGPLSRLWRRARALRELPKPDRIEEILDYLGFQNIQFSEQSRAIRMARSGMRIDVGGIGKGYALDEVLKVLNERHGIASALVDGGGDVAVGAPPPGRSGWQVEVRGTVGVSGVEIGNAALATSGDLHQGVEIEGRRWSHLIDPRTGMALTDSAAATVLAGSGMEADALASTLCLLSDAEGRALSRRRAGVEVRVSRLREDGSVEAWGTGQFAEPEGDSQGADEDPARVPGS